MSIFPHPCAEPDCGVLVAPSVTRCPLHARALEARRGTRAERGYGGRWAAMSKRWRRTHPFCAVKGPGCKGIARDVDHILPARRGGKAVWTNLQSVCRVCHAAKTKADAARWPT